MKPHPRILKTIKWIGAAVTLLLTIFYPFPNCNVGWTSSSGLACGLWDARLYFAAPGSAAAVQMKSDLARPSPPVRKFAGGFFWYPSLNPLKVGLPQLTLPAVSLAVTVLAWRLDTLACRRAKLNLCPNCNYDRAGLARHAKCPECGTIPPTI